MKMKLTVFSSCLIIFTGFLTGCASPPLTIVKPVSQCGSPGYCPSQNPVTQVELALKSSFDPSTSLIAYIDSNPALTGYSPAPAPGINTTVNITTPYTGRGPNACGTCEAIWMTHTLSVSDTCGFFCTDKTLQVTFIPPQIFFNGQGPTQSAISPSQSKPTPMYVSLPLTPTTAPVKVQIYEIGYYPPSPLKGPWPPAAPPSLSTYTVSLGTSPANMQPPGTPITVTIPNSGDGRAQFWIQGSTIVGTQIGIAGAAIGCQVGSAPGNIAP